MIKPFYFHVKIPDLSWAGQNNSARCSSSRQGYFKVWRSAEAAQVMVILGDAVLDGKEASVIHMRMDGS